MGERRGWDAIFAGPTDREDGGDTGAAYSRRSSWRYRTHGRVPISEVVDRVPRCEDCRMLQGAAVVTLLANCAVPAAGYASQAQADQAPAPQWAIARLLGGFNDSAESISAAFYRPSQNLRDIDVETLDFSQAWQFRKVQNLELLGLLGVFKSHGTRGDPPPGVSPDGTATGVTTGAGLRLYPLDVRSLHLYMEGLVEIDYILGNQVVFLAGGTGLNGFLRAGIGVLYDLGPKLGLEIGLQLAHVSNASGTSSKVNPQWNGRGVVLGLRRQF